MKPIFVFLLLFVAILAFPNFSKGADRDKDYTTYKNSMAKDFINGDKGGDFKKLRVLYSKTDKFKEVSFEMMTTEGPMIQAINDALGTGDFSGSTKFCLERLEKNFTDFLSHLVCKTSLGKTTGETQATQTHKYFSDGLVKSIITSGDGKTPETAFHVISVKEESQFIRYVLGLEKISQALLNENGHAYDLIQAQSPKNGKKFSIYFNVDLIFSTPGQ